MQPDFVTIAINVSPDEMSAHISLTPVDGRVGELRVEHLDDALEAAGVIRGISLPALRDITLDWNNDPRTISERLVATGVDAVPDKPGNVRMLVKYLSAPGDIKKAQSSRHFYEIATLSHKFQRVDRGMVIAKRAAAGPSLVGYTVLGAPIIPEKESPATVEVAAITEQNGVFVAGNTYTAAGTGIVYLENNDDEPKLIPLNFDGSIELHIAPDKMTAELSALPAGERGVMPSIDQARKLLHDRNVVFGINEEAFLDLMLKCAKGIDSAISIVIAEGMPPIKGDDGRVEFCFNTESSPAPVINPDGSVDYKNINIVTSVGAGTILARLHPPRQGTPGRNICGQIIKAVHGNPVALPVGTNTAIPNGKPDTLIAVTDGIPRFDGTAVNVSEGYVLPGDVDFSSGNVDYAGSVVVNGDIKSGFDVRCGGDLQVNGIIEDCRVTVKGNVLCRYGFTGTGKGIIEAGGDVNLMYVKNQTVVSDGNVTITKESINSNISARKSLNIYGQKLSAAGGMLISTGAIVVKTIGNISGIQTTLQIDPEPKLADELEKTIAAIEQHKKNIDKITKTIETMTPAQKADKEFTRKLKNTLITINKQIQEQEQRARGISILINRFENSFIRIDRIAYPGTTIRFGTRSMTLSDILTGGKTIKVIDGEIKVL